MQEPRPTPWSTLPTSFVVAVYLETSSQSHTPSVPVLSFYIGLLALLIEGTLIKVVL
jgi:hypothetical protein